MTIYRGYIIDTPRSPFEEADPETALRHEVDGALVVVGGRIVARGSFVQIRPLWPHEEVVTLPDGLLLPGFVDTHVHYPQIRAIGGLGMPLLDWLEHCALPEESRLSDDAYASQIAREFLAGLIASGTTSALVFGAHFRSAMECFFTEADASGLNITAGLVVGDRLLRPELHCTPEQARGESQALIERWHGHNRLRYAVTPRFSLSATDELLAVCGDLLRQGPPDLLFTSHINENRAEVTAVAELFPQSTSYLDTYDRHGLVTARSVLAHNVHATARELEVMAATGAWTAHCPTSNSSLGSGLFPLRAHLEAGVGVALGSDVGGGTGLFIGKEALQAYFMQQLSGDCGVALSPAHLLYLATSAGARALGLSSRVGDFEVGKEFDAVWIRPAAGQPLAVNLANARGAGDALARVFALATPGDVAQVWVGGRSLHPIHAGDQT